LGEVLITPPSTKLCSETLTCGMLALGTKQSRGKLLPHSEWAGNVARMGVERGAYRVLVGKPEGRRSLGRPRRRWVDNIMVGLQKVGCGYMDWIGLAQDRERWRTLVSAVMNFLVP